MPPRGNAAATDRAVRYVARGWSVTDAAKKCGVDVRTVRRALRRQGAPPKPPGRPKVEPE